MDKKRLDVALVERELTESREKAQRLIMAGLVRLNGAIISKASQKVQLHDLIQLIEKEKFVGRGGLKLDAALERFGISCKNKACLDVGASTGGFTDCLLQRDARKVFAVDVGENQIAWKLRQDPRVHILDRTNARYLDPLMLDELVDIVTMDVSFISVCKVLPAVLRCAQVKADFIILIKPQFEAGREQVGTGGVVRDPLIHQQVIEKVRIFSEKSLNLVWQDVMESPIQGPAGNKEFLSWFRIKN